MKFSLQWLTELVDHQIPQQELLDRLTMAGLEVDGCEAVANTFTGIVVAEVVSVEPHPDADKLNLCQVDDGDGHHQVVCGAPNVKAGMRAPFARLGAEIQTPGADKPFKIKAAKLRGVESQGMLCSAEELGLEESSEGLLALPGDAPIGNDVRDYLNLNDVSIELDLTPNRGDCLGMRGLAREVGVLSRQAVNVTDAPNINQTLAEEFPVSITAADACPRYLGRVIKGIDLDAESPLWLTERLRRSGLRSIDPVVDVTNYVLMELGQPMHAFDLDKLDAGITVRMANAGEKLTLLDGKEVELTPDTLVIADKSKAVAMAGIMGGSDSAVSDATSNVMLECAFFHPLAISGKARSYGMHTDASHRYERGVDYALQHLAMERATELLLAIAGGEAGPVVEATGNLPETGAVTLEVSNIERLLGISVPVDEVSDILTRLGFALDQPSEGTIVATVPTFRFDISIEADLIEEIARIYGYNRLPSTRGLMPQRLSEQPETTLSSGRIKAHLTAQGYQEVISYSFIDPRLSELVCPGASVVTLQNPLSEDMSVMRTSLLPALLGTLEYNNNRQQDRLKIFEMGMVFEQTGDGIAQSVRLGGLISGRRYPDNWINNKELHDFYDVKGDIESLLSIGQRQGDLRFEAAAGDCFHSGQCADVYIGATKVGTAGALHPAIRRKMELPAAVYLFELSLVPLQSVLIPRAQTLSKYPEVSRDMALVLDQDIPADAILQEVRENAGENLRTVRIFDVYQGDAIAKDKKSLALGLTWQHPSRTLSDEEINTIISSCVNALQNKFNANLRN